MMSTRALLIAFCVTFALCGAHAARVLHQTDCAGEWTPSGITGAPTSAVNCTDGVAPGNSCSTTCVGNYVGSLTATCTDGQWETTDTCTLQTCPITWTPTGIAGVPETAVTCADGAIGNPCAATCEGNYVGTVTATCVDNGETASWTTAQTCTLKPPICPTTWTSGITGAASATCADTAVGQTCNASCEGNYQGSLQATCVSSDGTTASWTTDDTCTPITCPLTWTPGPGVDGAPNTAVDCTDGVEVGNSCTATCQGNYEATDLTATCGADGQWSTIDTCALKKCATKPTAPSDPYADFGNCVEGSEPGYSCSATCAVGWTEVDAPVAECQLGGTWSVTGTCQRVDCPGTFESGPASGTCSSVLFEDSCTGGCGAGYAGSASATCSADGTWNVTHSCIKLCESAPSSNAWASFAGAAACAGKQAGEECVGVCQEGWIPAATGNPTVTCRADGTWGDITNKCTKPVCLGTAAVDAGASGASFTCSNQPIGSTCVGKCAGKKCKGTVPKSVCVAAPGSASGASWGVAEGVCNCS